ncbi:MAG: amidohydrolase family protein, partial [Mycobacterium sp.]
MLIRGATRLDGAVVDLRVGAQIDEVGEDLTPLTGEDVFDAAGGTVLPGLHDHHVHLHSA